TVIPIIALLIQVYFFQGPLLWPAVALTVIFIFIFLQAQNDTRDYLTGLLNRQQIDDIIHVRIRDFQKRGVFSLIILDMDEFKFINDTYGHNQGDEALIQLSSVLSSSVKSSDKVARFGGDEFLILLDTGDPVEVEKIIERIQKKIDLVNDKDDKLYNIAFSAGFAVYCPSKYSDFISLFNDVDQKMYDVKKRKKKDPI
ncbi:MAG: GGDEF domain-containing protein, partial [Spirochaetales bacterium]|nr:GGDEF domain-containing protein [Spirochaetales bacterium]